MLTHSTHYDPTDDRTQPVLPSWLTKGEAPELPPARDGYQFWECYSVDQMEGFTRIAGVTRETVEFLRDQILRKIVRAERNGGIPLRHYRMRWESEAYEFAAAQRMGLAFNAHALNVHLSAAEVLKRGAQRRAMHAQYSQVPELTITEKALRDAQRARDLADPSGDQALTAKLGALLAVVPEVE